MSSVRREIAWSATKTLAKRRWGRQLLWHAAKTAARAKAGALFNRVKDLAARCGLPVGHSALRARTKSKAH